jgi:hypothetical protein
VRINTIVFCVILFSCNFQNNEKQRTSEDENNYTSNKIKGVIIDIKKYEPLGTATHFYNLILTNDSSNFLKREQEPHVRNFLLPDSLLIPLVNLTQELLSDSINYYKESTGIKICIREGVSEICTISNKKNAYTYLMKIDSMYQSNPQLGNDVAWIKDIMEVYRYQYHIK